MTAGDRTIEWPWALFWLPTGPKDKCRVLDFGGGEGIVSAFAVRFGHEVDYIDLGGCCFEHPNLYTFTGDYRSMPDRGLYDYIACCSTIEHVGLGRYGDKIEADGDLIAMEWIRHKLQPHGQIALTIPVGIDSVCGQMHRIYGRKRLPQLLFGCDVISSEYWANKNGTWIDWSVSECLSMPGSESEWCLGLYLLQKN